MPSELPHGDPRPAAGDPPSRPELPSLPELPGGWEERHVELGPFAVPLWVPRAPDALLDDPDVIQRNQVHDAMPYWAWVWDSAPRLAALVARGVLAPRGPLLEVGAGLGLVGLVAARLGAAVTLSDHDPLARAALAVNARHNGVTVAVSALDWRAPETYPRGPFPTIVGCDVVYEAGAHTPLLDLLDALLAPSGAAWFADPGRSRLAGFVRRAEARGYRVATLDADGAPAPLAPGEFRVLRLTR